MIDFKMLKKADINCQNGLARFANNLEIYEENLNRFVEDKHYYDLKKAYKKNDLEEMKYHARVLEDMSGTLELTKIYNHSSKLKSALKNNSGKKVDRYMELLAPAYEDAVSIIKDALI